jgi:hypothetical protein
LERHNEATELYLLWVRESERERRKREKKETKETK